MSTVVVLLCIAVVAAFLGGLLLGMRWEQSSQWKAQQAELPRVFETSTTSTSSGVLFHERKKCRSCGADVRLPQHDGSWRCTEHKGVV